jgi:DNA-binding MarR family transcriptional regulator
VAKDESTRKNPKKQSDPDRSKKTAPELSVDAFGDVVVGAIKLITSLEDFGPFGEIPIGVSEWSALRLIGNGRAGSMKGLGREMGFPKQRAAQLGEALKRAGYVTATKNTEDSREDELALTDSGRARLARVEADLGPILLRALAGREKTLSGTRKSMKMLLYVTDPEKGERSAEKRKRAKADKEGKEPRA